MSSPGPGHSSKKFRAPGSIAVCPAREVPASSDAIAAWEQLLDRVELYFQPLDRCTVDRDH